MSDKWRFDPYKDYSREDYGSAGGGNFQRFKKKKKKNTDDNGGKKDYRRQGKHGKGR